MNNRALLVAFSFSCSLAAVAPSAHAVELLAQGGGAISGGDGNVVARFRPWTSVRLSASLRLGAMPEGDMNQAYAFAAVSVGWLGDGVGFDLGVAITPPVHLHDGPFDIHEAPLVAPTLHAWLDPTDATRIRMWFLRDDVSLLAGAGLAGASFEVLFGESFTAGVFGGFSGSGLFTGDGVEPQTGLSLELALGEVFAIQGLGSVAFGEQVSPGGALGVRVRF